MAARRRRVADVARPRRGPALVAAAVREFGHLDILVNNAGVRREVDFASLEYAGGARLCRTTLDGAYLCSRAALPHLIASGAGSIVNIGGLSSHTGVTPRTRHRRKSRPRGTYQSVAHDLAPHQITVNCVAPGLVDTARSGPEPAHHKSLAAPMGRKRPTRKLRTSSASCAVPVRDTLRGRRFTRMAASTWGSPTNVGVV